MCMIGFVLWVQWGREMGVVGSWCAYSVLRISWCHRVLGVVEP